MKKNDPGKLGVCVSPAFAANGTECAVCLRKVDPFVGDLYDLNYVPGCQEYEAYLANMSASASGSAAPSASVMATSSAMASASASAKASPSGATFTSGASVVEIAAMAIVPVVGIMAYFV